MFIFFCSSSKVKMLALTKNENGHARMLASARIYPISVATLYVPCESVSIQNLLKVDLTRTDVFWATQLICSCTCYFTEIARKEFRPELAWHKQTCCQRRLARALRIYLLWLVIPKWLYADIPLLLSNWRRRFALKSKLQNTPKTLYALFRRWKVARVRPRIKLIQVSLSLVNIANPGRTPG